jgi:glycosyltransferase involved in cell wall biosynthesis
MCRQHPEHEFHFVFDRPYHPSFLFSKNVKAWVIPPQARHPFLYFLWFEISLPLLIRSIKPDILVSPDGFLPTRPGTKSLMVIHDLNFEHYPADLPWLTGKYLRFFFRQGAKRSTHIATVSEFSKSDIVRLYQIAPEKISVVYNGANIDYKPLDSDSILKTREFYTNGAPYFLFIGTLHPRKNLVNLFRAFDLFRQKNPTSNTKLLIVGAKKWWTPEIASTYEHMKHKEEVIFTGRLSTSSLHHVLASALAMTYVSYFEGFGIPIIEAFSCDIPVITSNVTSMPEIAGDAALLCDPFDSVDIARAMTRINNQPELRQQLIEKSRIQREKFSWQKTADLLWGAIEKTIQY